MLNLFGSSFTENSNSAISPGAAPAPSEPEAGWVGSPRGSANQESAWQVGQMSPEAPPAFQLEYAVARVAFADMFLRECEQWILWDLWC